MYCPNCGIGSSTEQKFCRKCGLALERFADALAEELPARGPDEFETKGELLERQKRIEWWLTAVLAVAGSLLVGALLYGIVAKMMIGKGEYLKGVIFFVFIVGLISALGLVFYNETLKEKIGRKAQTREPALQPKAAETGKLLPESRFEPAASVTERTTDLLGVEARGSRRER